MPSEVPTFRQRRMAENVEFVYESGMTWITRASDDDVSLSLGGDEWTPTHKRLALKHQVTGITLESTSLPAAGLAVLDGIDSLRELSLTVNAPIDLAPLERLRCLTSLWLYWALAYSPPIVAFDCLNQLEDCRISLSTQFASVLNCRKLTVLRIRASRFRDDAPTFVDLTRLARLRELGFWNCSRVCEFVLVDKTPIEALEIINCRRLKIPWQLFGTTLKHLSLGGKLGFELQEVTGAAELETLMLADMKLKGDLRFLRELPNLKAIDIPIPIGLSPEAKKTIREINDAHGHGPVLTTVASPNSKAQSP